MPESIPSPQVAAKQEDILGAGKHHRGGAGVGTQVKKGRHSPDSGVAVWSSDAELLAVESGSGVGVEMAVGVAVAVADGVDVGELVAVGVGVGTTVGVEDGARVAVAVGATVGVGVGLAATATAGAGGARAPVAGPQAASPKLRQRKTRRWRRRMSITGNSWACSVIPECWAGRRGR